MPNNAKYCQGLFAQICILRYNIDDYIRYWWLHILFAQIRILRYVYEMCYWKQAKCEATELLDIEICVGGCISMLLSTDRPSNQNTDTNQNFKLLWTINRHLKACGRLLPFAVPYTEWTDQPHPFPCSLPFLTNQLWQPLEITPLQICEFKV